MQAQASHKEFIPWADLIHVAATLLVITVHVSGQITNLWGKVPESDWLIANIYGGIARICVPLFFMISGYLLLPRAESLRTFYKKRLPKVVIPLIVWSFIYLSWYCGNHHGTCTLPLVRNMLFVQGTYYHLWFMYSLLGIYLILPVLRLMVKPEEHGKILWYLIALWLIFQPGLAIAKQFWGFKININAPLTTGFVGLFIPGYLLGRWPLSGTTIILSGVLFFTATAVTIIGTYLLTRASGQFNNFFYDLISLNVILASAAAFLLLRKISEARLFIFPKAHDLLRLLASCAFGIYLVHVLVIEVLQDWLPGIHLDSLVGNLIWSIPLVVAIVHGISFLIVHVLQKIPILSRIVP